MTACFNSTSRAQWEAVHSRITDAPAVGKYTPKFLPKQSGPLFVCSDRSQLASRQKERTQQQLHVCFKQVKKLNLPASHKLSNAATLALSNRKVLSKEIVETCGDNEEVQRLLA